MRPGAAADRCVHNGPAVADHLQSAEPVDRGHGASVVACQWPAVLARHGCTADTGAGGFRDFRSPVRLWVHGWRGRKNAGRARALVPMATPVVDADGHGDPGRRGHYRYRRPPSHDPPTGPARNTLWRRNIGGGFVADWRTIS